MDAAAAMLKMMEDVLDRKLPEIVERLIITQNEKLYGDLRLELAEIKSGIQASMDVHSHLHEEFKAEIIALKNLVHSQPGSTISSQESGTTLSSAAEFRAQPMPDEIDAATMVAVNGDYWPECDLPPHQDGGLWLQTYHNEGELWSPMWTKLDAEPGQQLDSLRPQPPEPATEICIQMFQTLEPPGQHDHYQAEPASSSYHPRPVMISAIAAPIGTPLNIGGLDGGLQLEPTPKIAPPSDSESERRSPASFLHRRHNPKSCMVCRGSFKKRSSCKEHMLKCLKSNAQCQFIPNCAKHQQLIRPFSGETTEVRWKSAVAEWIHRKE